MPSSLSPVGPLCSMLNSPKPAENISLGRSLSHHALRCNQTLMCCVNPSEQCSNPTSGSGGSPSALHYEAVILMVTLHTQGGEETDAGDLDYSQGAQSKHCSCYGRVMLTARAERGSFRQGEASTDLLYRERGKGDT
ncbi:unnamed protein product [Pleuronectes platessa]|uniref:Uncharacterized protein n=1 Tax=Pleuronectes platessa TaxID=8262 RepID=A0A9N7YAZ8_PLEPL|nr:unnamed protein product [Pleuronectes platessa]